MAECLGNIGLVYSDRGDHRRALEYYARELRVLRKAFREGHPRVAEAILVLDLQGFVDVLAYQTSDSPTTAE